MKRFSILAISDSHLIAHACGVNTDRYDVHTAEVIADDPVAAFKQRFDISRAKMVDLATEYGTYCMIYDGWLFVPSILDDMMYVVVPADYNPDVMYATIHQKMSEAIGNERAEILT